LQQSPALLTADARFPGRGNWRDDRSRDPSVSPDPEIGGAAPLMGAQHRLAMTVNGVPHGLSERRMTAQPP